MSARDLNLFSLRKVNANASKLMKWESKREETRLALDVRNGTQMALGAMWVAIATFHTRNYKTSHLFRKSNGAQKCADLRHLNLLNLELAAAPTQISRVKIARHGAMTRAGATQTRTVRVQTPLQFSNSGALKSARRDWSQYSLKLDLAAASQT